jgi:hypothetical protein
VLIRRFSISGLLFLLLVGCTSNERMENLYAQRCLGCHGTSGRGDGPVAASLPTPVPDFRETVSRKSVSQIRKIIAHGKGLMPAYEPALSGAEIRDMVFVVRLLSRQGRSLEWWEKFEPLVWAHCSVPWEFVLGYDESGERDTP